MDLFIVTDAFQFLEIYVMVFIKPRCATVWLIVKYYLPHL